MFFKKILISVYKLISKFYVLIFGRKKLQFINDLFLSLTLDAKGFKNYGDFTRTGERKFVKNIKKEINLTLDVGAIVGNFTKLILLETNSKVILEPCLMHIKNKDYTKPLSDRLKIHNFALGNQNNKQELIMEHKDLKASLMSNLENYHS